MGKIIGVISIKGGVGKTSVVSSLGATIANEFNKKVLLVDANFSAPNLALHFGLISPEITLHHILGNRVKAENAIYEINSNFHIIPGALIHNKKIDPKKLKNKIKYLKDYYDYIIIDSSPTLNDEILATMMASDEIYVVTTPDHVTLSTTLRAVKLAKQRRTQIHGLILNKVHNKKFELSTDEIEKTSDCDVLAILPFDVRILEALSKNTPSTQHKRSRKRHFSYEYKALAGAIIGEKYKDPRLKSRLKRLFKRLSKHEVNRMLFRDRDKKQ